MALRGGDPRCCPRYAFYCGMGHFAADVEPIFTLKSGEVATMDTICGIPEMLEQLCALLWPIDVNDPDTCKHARKTARGKSANLLN